MSRTPLQDRQDTRSPAEIYDEGFVPALFGRWAPVVCEAAGIAAGQRVLDVACGTGALTVAVARRVAPDGAAVGLDASADMLAVARRRHRHIDWREGRAEALPFDSASFDRVVSQFGLMFFDDRVAALREMRRVLRPAGRLAVAVWDAVDTSPGYRALAALLQRLFGAAVAASFSAPFALGDEHALRALCARAGLADATIERRTGNVVFASVDALLSTERACVWTLGGVLDDEQFTRLREAAQVALNPFTDTGGRVDFGISALLIRAGSGALSPAQRAMP